MSTSRITSRKLSGSPLNAVFTSGSDHPASLAGLRLDRQRSVEPLLDLLERDGLGLAPRLAVPVDEYRIQDGQQPGFAVGSGPEVVKRPVGAQAGFLNEIARVLVSRGQPPGHVGQRRQKWQGRGLEAVSLFVDLRSIARRHRLRPTRVSLDQMRASDRGTFRRTRLFTHLCARPPARRGRTQHYERRTYAKRVDEVWASDRARRRRWFWHPAWRAGVSINCTSWRRGWTGRSGSPRRGGTRFISRRCRRRAWGEDPIPCRSSTWRQADDPAAPGGARADQHRSGPGRQHLLDLQVGGCDPEAGGGDGHGRARFWTGSPDPPGSPWIATVWSTSPRCPRREWPAEATGSSFPTVPPAVLHEGEPEPTDIVVSKKGEIYWTCKSAGVILEQEERHDANAPDRPGPSLRDRAGKNGKTLFLRKCRRPECRATRADATRSGRSTSRPLHARIVHEGDPEPTDVAAAKKGNVYLDLHERRRHRRGDADPGEPEPGRGGRRLSISP